MADFDILADEIFPPKPFNPEDQASPTYVLSHTFAQPHLSPDTRSVFSDKNDFAEDDLSKWLTDQSRLGPGERHLFGTIFNCPSNYILLVGYAGCGKTSTIRYVLDHYEKRRRVKEEADDWPIDGVRAFAGIGKVVKPYVYIDFDRWIPLAEGLASTNNPKEIVNAEFEKFFLGNLRRQVLRMVEAAAVAIGKDPLQCFVEMIKLLCELSSQTVRPSFVPFFPDVNSAERISVLLGSTRDGWTEWKKAKAAILELVESIDLKFEQIEFWGACLNVVHSEVRRFGGTLILVLDNIDPLDGFLHVHLSRMIHSALNLYSFKIVVPARTATRRMMKFTNHGYHHYPHLGPSPISVVTFRLIEFLSRPEKCGTYAGVKNERWRYRAKCRAFDLLVRLLRGSSDYRSLGRHILDLCGSSVRRALWFARILFQLEEFNSNYEANAETEKGLSSLLQNVCVRLFLIEAASEMSVITASCVNIVRGRGSVTNRILEFASTFVDQYSQSVISIAKNVFSAVQPPPDSEMAATISRILFNEETGAFFSAEVSSSLTDALSDIQGEDQSRRLGAVIGVLLILKYRIISLASDWNLGEQSVTSFIDAIIQIACVHEGALKNSLVDRHRDEFFSQEPFPTILRNNKPAELEDAFLRSPNIVDVFHFKDGPICAAMPWILFKLLNTDAHSYPNRSLLKQLKYLGFDERDILESMNRLMAEEARFIWVDSGFGYEKYTDLATEACDVTLTDSGASFSQRLIWHPRYLIAQAARSKIGNEKKMPPLGERLVMTVGMLRDLGQSEIIMIKKRKQQLGSDNFHQFRREALQPIFVSLNIAARACDLFRKFVREQFGRYVSLGRQEQLRGFLVEYAQLLEAMIANARDLYEVDLPSKYDVLDEASWYDKVGEFRRSLAERPQIRVGFLPYLYYYRSQHRLLTQDLEGEAFWATGMRGDEYKEADD